MFERLCNHSMRFFHLARFVPLYGALILTIGSLNTPVEAAPVGESAPLAGRQAFLPDFRVQVKDDPSLAPQLLREFWQNSPNQKVQFLITTSIEAARILWRGDHSQTENALSLLDMTLQRFPDTRIRYLAVEAKVEILRKSDRLEEAAQLLETTWPQVKSRNLDKVMLPLLSEWVEVLQEQKKPEQAIELLQDTLQNASPLANWVNFYRLMIDAQVEAGHNEEALRWAGAFFRIAPFEDEDIARATARVTRLWLQDAKTMGNPALFTAAQGDVMASNPLQQVALPELSAPLRASLQARVKSEADKEAAPSRIAMFLLLGETHAAMSEAREILLRDPTDPAGTSEVARVFKAADGDVARANAFLEFYRTGKGENPLIEFLREGESREVTP